MRNPPAHDLTGGADERLPVRRPAPEPADGGAALVEHLVERLAGVEQDLRAARGATAAVERERALIGRVATHLADHGGAPVSDLVRLALPMLGDWCIVESVVGDGVERTVVAAERVREQAVAGLAGGFTLGMDESLVLERVARTGRAERLPALPGASALGDGASRALHALGDGPVLLVPVCERGGTIGAMAFGRDDGGYDASEQRLAGELAGLVALAMMQRRANARAEEGARAKSEFLTMMSHELRTPLNAIAGYAQLLEMGFRGPLTEGQREAVSRILRGQEHLLQLVDSVLTLSRLTSGHLPLGAEQVGASTLVDMASDPMRREFRDRGIDLHVTRCPAELRVVADRERAPQVLRHLLSNALKFTEPGGRVTVGCDCDERHVRFTVSDTGRGIPPAQCQAIFQPFVQAETGHTRSADGSGLGLAISRELAERMGGSLMVSSELGVGSRFVLALPRASAPGA